MKPKPRLIWKRRTKNFRPSLASPNNATALRDHYADVEGGVSLPAVLGAAGVAARGGRRPAHVAEGRRLRAGVHPDFAHLHLERGHRPAGGVHALAGLRDRGPP